MRGRSESQIRNLSQYKICVTGAAGVGKTSIATQYAHGRFQDTHITTIGVDLLTKYETLELGRSNNELVCDKAKLLINDTSGEERFAPVMSARSRDAHIVIGVYDMADRRTVKLLRGFLTEAVQLARPGAIVVVVGNKLDLVEHESVLSEEICTDKGWASPSQVEKLRADFDCELRSVSAKTGKNVDFLFKEVAARAHRSQALSQSTEVAATILPTAFGPNGPHKAASCC